MTQNDNITSSSVLQASKLSTTYKITKNEESVPIIYIYKTKKKKFLKTEYSAPKVSDYNTITESIMLSI